MKLMRITAQSPEDLHQFYDLSSKWAGDHWHKPIAAMLELVEYLEQGVDFQSQWVFTSHQNLCFAGQNDSCQSLVSVHPLKKIPGITDKARFEISYPAEKPWSHTVGYANTVEQAWQMIKSKLSKIQSQSV